MPSFLKLAEVARRTSLSPATVRRRVAQGEFPPPIRISAGRVAWLDTAIEDWMEAVAIHQARPVAFQPSPPHECSSAGNPKAARKE